MNINSILDITDGELLTSPSISSIYNIKSSSKRVSEGDLFIARSTKGINDAIKNGAFAIIYDFETEIIDKEIAWIKVESTLIALKKLLRFKLSNLELNVFHCDSFSADLLNVYKNISKDTIVIKESIDDMIKLIENIGDTNNIFSNNLTFIKEIYPKYKNFNINFYAVSNLIRHSLFETSFSHENNFFTKIKIPSLYINQFIDVFNFLNKEIDTKKLTKLKIFDPIFVDKYLNIIDFGKSSKFIVAQNETDLLRNEIDYINHNFSYGKTVIISRSYIEDINSIVIKRIKNIKSYLRENDFNAVYIIGFDKKKIEKFLEISSIKRTNLF